MLLRDFLLRLHLCKGIGIVGKYRIYEWLSQFQLEQISAPAVEQLIKVGQIKARSVTTFSSSYIQLMRNSNLVSKIIGNDQWVSLCDSRYPSALKESYAPPIIMFYRGNLSLATGQLLGIVGARDASEYSFEILKKLIPGEISHRMTIVSGLAKGVDTWAHQCAIANQGKTIAVIGTGLDIAYPAANKYLQAQIGRDHLLISEYPSGTKGFRNHFPERNRIIAGLVQSLLVTEAKHHSGSLITANLALQNNRNVLAVPGNIIDDLSVGTNELIAAGAKPILCARDILEEFIS